MLTTKLISLHKKCASILSLIQTVNDNISADRLKLFQFDNEKNPFHIIRLTNLRHDIISSLDHSKKVKARLVGFYANTHVMLSQDAIKKCYRHFDFINS